MRFAAVLDLDASNAHALYNRCTTVLPALLMLFFMLQHEALKGKKLIE